jgi:hypothetical protein
LEHTKNPFSNCVAAEPKEQKLKGYGEENLAADPRNKITASSIVNNDSAYYGPAHALPGATSQPFWQANGSSPQWWSVELPEPKIVGRFQFKLYNAVNDPADFSLDASHDGTNWQTIMEQTNQTGQANEVKTYELMNKNKFLFYRICIKKAMNGGNPVLSCLTMNEAIF